MALITSEDQNTIIDDESQIKYVAMKGIGSHRHDCAKCHLSKNSDSWEQCDDVPCCYDDRHDKSFTYYITV